MKNIFYTNDTHKEFVCRQCTTFLNSEDLVDGKCPNCNTDEDIVANDIDEDEDEMLVNVFNHQINNCTDCIFSDMRNQECDFVDNIKLTESGDVNYFKEIHSDCPFTKSIIPEDIEMFGFLFSPTFNKYKKKLNGDTYFLKFFNDISCKVERLQNGETYLNTMFQGNITSKPHLEFILQTLNII